MMDDHTRVTLAIVRMVGALVLLLIVAGAVLAYLGKPAPETWLGAGTGIGGLLAYLSPSPRPAGSAADGNTQGA